jgi:hypothetical protein
VHTAIVFQGRIVRVSGQPAPGFFGDGDDALVEVGDAGPDLLARDLAGRPVVQLTLDAVGVEGGQVDAAPSNGELFVTWMPVRTLGDPIRGSLVYDDHRRR